MLSRKINPITKKLMLVQYGKEINSKNIEKISRFKINKVLRLEENEVRNIFLHNVISDWINKRENHDEDFFLMLNKLIRKTKIDISIEEEHDLFLLEERAFSKERHIKVIEVNFKLTPKERVGVKFVKAQLLKKENERLEPILKDDLLISNRRVIFPINNKSFKFSEISAYWYKEYGFEFKVKEELYVLRIHDQETLNNTIENIISKKVKNAIKKRKDN